MPTYTYQYGENPPIDYPRFLVPDTDMTKPIFADEEILMAGQITSFAVYPPVGGGYQRTFGAPSPRIIAASLIDILASNAARLGNTLKVLDIQLDKTKAAASLKAQAQALRDAEQNMGRFAIAEMCVDQFSMRERWIKQVLRTSW